MYILLQYIDLMYVNVVTTNILALNPTFKTTTKQQKVTNAWVKILSLPKYSP